MNMVGNDTLRSDAAYPVMAVTMRHAVLLDSQVKVPDVIQIVCVQFVNLPS